MSEREKQLGVALAINNAQLAIIKAAALLDAEVSKHNDVADLAEELAMVVNDLYSWADRNPEDLEDGEAREHRKLMTRAKNALKRFDRT